MKCTAKVKTYVIDRQIDSVFMGSGFEISSPSMFSAVKWRGCQQDCICGAQRVEKLHLQESKAYVFRNIVKVIVIVIVVTYIQYISTTN